MADRSPEDIMLARRYAPVIYFDADEPFLPTCAGYTIVRTPEPSPSFPRYIMLEPPSVLAIEYALWWDWDIQHLYELEHAWVFVDSSGTIIAVESSQHGAATDGDFHQEAGRPILYAEPGKHALTSRRADLQARRAGTERACSPGAGRGGVWITPLYRDRIARTPVADQLVRTHLRRHAFTPRWDWSQRVDVAELPLVPWPLLDTAIPAIVAARIAELERLIPYNQRHVWHISRLNGNIVTPEQTSAAIREAAMLGADMVELAVRIGAGGRPVLTHGMAPAGIELQTPSHDENVPTLADALDLCSQLGLGVYVEIKEAAAVEAVTGELTMRGLGRSSIVGAHNPAWVGRATDRAPHIATAIRFDGFEVDPVALARGCGARYVHPYWERHSAPHTLLTPAWLAAVRIAGLGILCWPEQRPPVIQALLQHGVSGIYSIDQAGMSRPTE